MLFAHLTEADFRDLHRPIDQLDYAAGATLYRAGDEGLSLFTVRTGLVKLAQYLPDGTQRIVRLLGKTDVLGLECMAGTVYQHSAIALQPTEVCRLPVTSVKRLMRGNPQLFHTLMAHWYRALSDADRWIAELLAGTARERVIRLRTETPRLDPGTQSQPLFLRHRQASKDRLIMNATPSKLLTAPSPSLERVGASTE